MKKRTFSLFLGFIFTLTLVFSFSSSAFASDSSENYMKIKIPAGWKKNSSVSEVYAPLKGGATVIIQKNGLQDNANTPEKFLANAKKETTAIYTKVTFKPIKKLKVAGKVARSLEYIAKVGPFEMQYYVVYVFDGDYVNILICSAIKDKYKSYTADFQKFVKSIKL
jgi:hypothetical protein